MYRFLLVGLLLAACMEDVVSEDEFAILTFEKTFDKDDGLSKLMPMPLMKKIHNEKLTIGFTSLIKFAKENNNEEWLRENFLPLIERSMR